MLKKCSGFVRVRVIFSCVRTSTSSGHIAHDMPPYERGSSHECGGAAMSEGGILRGHNMCGTRPSTRVGRGVGKRKKLLFF